MKEGEVYQWLLAMIAKWNIHITSCEFKLILRHSLTSQTQVGVWVCGGSEAELFTGVLEISV